MLDELDRKILATLQVDSSLSVQEIGDRVGLSSTPCWRRIQKLESTGYIRRRVALLNADKLNLGVSVFIAVRTNQHNAEWAERFKKTVIGFPEVVDFFRLSGDVDYLIRAVVPDIAAYDAVYKKLIRAADFMDVSSSFAMEELKFTTTMPLTVGESNRENVNLQVGSTPRSLWVLLRVRNRIQLLGEAQEAMCRSGPHGDHEVGLRDPCSYT